MNIKSEINKLLEKYKRLYKIYPITLIIIFITTFLLLIFMEDLNDNLITEFIEFLLIYVIGTMFTEVFFDKKKRMFSYLIFMLLAIIFVVFINLDNSLISDITERILYTYFLSFIIIIVYKLYKNSKKDLSHYLLSVAFDTLKISVIYGILSTGLLLISEVFITLFLEDNDYEFVIRIELLLFGLFYIPLILENLSEIKKEINNFMKVLVHYTLLSLIILAFIIIYIYLFKIIITWTFPSNQIFRILSSLFIFYLPIWIMNTYYRDDLLAKINDKLPILFIPFILLQIYSLGIRIINNGFTNIRYIGIMIIIIEIVYIILYFNKKKFDYLFYVFPIIVIITFILPYFNMYDVSGRSQIMIMDNILIKDNLSNIDKKTLYSSYTYLNSFYVGKNYLNKYDKNLLSKISNYYPYENKYNYEYINANRKWDSLDISDYYKVYNIDYRNYNINRDEILITDNDYQINITSIIMSYIENKDNIENYFKENNEFIMDNSKLIITNLEIELNDNKISYIYINGILLK